MSKQERIPHIENVDLVPESRAHDGAPGFNLQFNLVPIVGLSVLILLSYIIFGA